MEDKRLPKKKCKISVYCSLRKLRVISHHSTAKKSGLYKLEKVQGARSRDCQVKLFLTETQRKKKGSSSAGKKGRL